MDYGDRKDGSAKGSGFFGELKRPGGGVSTEISVGVGMDGKEMDIPLIVPTLNKKELDYLLNTDLKDKSFFSNMPRAIMQKAYEHANTRRKSGMSVFAEEGEVSEAPTGTKARDKIFGYEIRDPYDSENSYFKENQHVTGMAADDGRIILNPFSGLSPESQRRVAGNEATRLHMREKGYEFDFPVPQADQAPFKGTVYADPENLHHLQSTIIARGVVGDSSAGEITPEQQVWVDRIKAEMLAKD
jgi:hypothetical protein